jgi:tartrate dehydrogenase/decarboxylase / D-malate dehydrogenase
VAYEIAVIPGDNVGPEVVREALKVLRKLEALGYGSFQFTEFPWGAGYYLKTGLPMPEDGLETLKGFDAVLFGAHGDPARVPEAIPSQGMTHKIRKAFDLYANVRPIRLIPGVLSPIRDKSEIDFVVVRENSEGEYSGIGGRLHVGNPEEVAIQVSVITRAGAERVMRYAFELARKRNGKKRVTAATKSNALNHSMPFWDEVFAQVSSQYPDVEPTKFHVDALSMQLIKQPEYFDVIVATSMFGDILSDEAAMIAGGVGMAPGANLNPERRFPSMFEPIHGSAPKYAGKNLINPLATILAARMMLGWLGESDAADLIGNAVDHAVSTGRARTRDMGGQSTTTEMGDAVCNCMEEIARG